MESYFCLSLKRPVSHKGQRMCKTSLRPAAAMSEVNMKRVQAGVSPPLFRAGAIARHQGAADVSHLKYWSSAREAFSTSDATVSTAELPRQDMSSENNLASSSPFQRADSLNKSSFQIYIFTSTLKLFFCTLDIDVMITHHDGSNIRPGRTSNDPRLSGQTRRWPVLTCAPRPACHPPQFIIRRIPPLFLPNFLPP